MKMHNNINTVTNYSHSIHYDSDSYLENFIALSTFSTPILNYSTLRVLIP